MLKGKLIKTRDAKVTNKQHMSPCSDCPFLRDAVPGWLGMTPAKEWDKMARNRGDSCCHATKKAIGGQWACAGLAIYRANIGVPDPEKLGLKPDTERVFSSSGEFVEHHEKGELS